MRNQTSKNKRTKAADANLFLFLVLKGIVAINAQIPVYLA
jgi:hypothetical protein